MDNSLKRVSRASPLRGCDAPSVAERSTLDHASAMSPFYLGRRLILFVGHKKYPGAAPDRGRITAFRGSTSHQRPRQVSISRGLAATPRKGTGKDRPEKRYRGGSPNE